MVFRKSFVPGWTKNRISSEDLLSLIVEVTKQGLHKAVDDSKIIAESWEYDTDAKDYCGAGHISRYADGDGGEPLSGGWAIRYYGVHDNGFDYQISIGVNKDGEVRFIELHTYGNDDRCMSSRINGGGFESARSLANTVLQAIKNEKKRIKANGCYAWLMFQKLDEVS